MNAFCSFQTEIYGKVLPAPGVSGKMFLVTVIILLFCSCATSSDSRLLLVGGPCQYKSYPGQATIISIARMESSQPQETERFAVLFTFQPRTKVDEVFAQDATNKYYLYGDNFQYPDQDFIARHRLEAGQKLKGKMQVITSGTCKPVLFEFPDLKN